jgi:hypothetical protein
MKTTGTAFRIPRGKPGEPDLRIRGFRRKLATVAGVVVIILLGLSFPAILAFVELASREIRYLWWLIALFALGIWLVFSLGRKRP